MAEVQAPSIRLKRGLHVSFVIVSHHARTPPSPPVPLCSVCSWVDVLRCISRWELLLQMTSGQPTDAVLFSAVRWRAGGPRGCCFGGRPPKPHVGG